MRRYAFFAAAALLFACSGITEPLCACSPPGSGTAVITGIVTDAAMAPVGSATVKLRVVKENCEEPDTTITTAVQSGATGRFRHSMSWSGGRKCFRLWAEPPQGSALAASDSQFVRIDFQDGAVPDSVELVFQLR